MKALPEQMAREVGAALREAEEAHMKATAIIGSPKGYQPEALEDALNALQDAGYRARSAFRVSELLPTD